MYSTGELGPEKRSAIRDGLDIVGRYVGGISVVKSARVRLGTTKGRVRPDKVGYSAFDAKVPLHIFVAPYLSPRGAVRSDLLGSSFKGTGVSWVQERVGKGLLPTVTAHEVAHSLGFVLEGAPQNIRSTDGHCSSDECLMYPSTTVSEEDAASLAELKELDKWLGGIGTSSIAKRLMPEDFCLPCKADIRGEYEANLGRMYLARARAGGITLTAF